MTEHADNTDQAERIRRLQERRAASSASRAARTQSRSTEAVKPTAATAARPARTTGRKRRRHPAGASRILLAGLSVASFFTIGGSLMLAQNNAATVSQATPDGRRTGRDHRHDDELSDVWDVRDPRGRGREVPDAACARGAHDHPSKLNARL